MASKKINKTCSDRDYVGRNAWAEARSAKRKSEKEEKWHSFVLANDVLWRKKSKIKNNLNDEEGNRKDAAKNVFFSSFQSIRTQRIRRSTDKDVCTSRRREVCFVFVFVVVAASFRSVEMTWKQRSKQRHKIIISQPNREDSAVYIARERAVCIDVYGVGKAICIYL